MSASKTSGKDLANDQSKRSLPSWTNSEYKGGGSCGKNQTGSSQGIESSEDEKPKQAKEHGKQYKTSESVKEIENSKKCPASSSRTSSLSKLLEGVVFVLSGFVNPERSILRSQALEMGAEYQPDWNSVCTLLVCAFPNTPKFRQVEADCGTIVSKEWIAQCYSEKKLIEIEKYLMHAGKPWRRSNVSQIFCKDLEGATPGTKQKLERGSHSKPTVSTVPKNKASIPATEPFSPSKVKKWVIDDFDRTVSWLEAQEEKPEQSEIKKIAAEGILTCLQDAIDSLEQKEDIRTIIENWNFIPHVVGELAKLDTTGDKMLSISKEDLCNQAVECKRIYEMELRSMEDDSPTKEKNPKTDEQERGKRTAITSDVVGYDSDDTIEMTEEEIELAYNNASCKIHLS